MEQLNKGSNRRQRLEQRNKRIKEVYASLSSKRIGKARKFSEEAIIVMISEKFYLSEGTVENILYNRIKYKTPRSNGRSKRKEDG